MEVFSGIIISMEKSNYYNRFCFCPSCFLGTLLETGRTSSYVDEVNSCITFNGHFVLQKEIFIILTFLIFKISVVYQDYNMCGSRMLYVFNTNIRVAFFVLKKHCFSTVFCFWFYFSRLKIIEIRASVNLKEKGVYHLPIMYLCLMLFRSCSGCPRS